jgi:Flp pilus assembly protein TadD
MKPSREDQLKFAKHFERAQGWLLLENHAAAEKALRLVPVVFRARAEVQQFRAQLHLSCGQWAKAVPLLRRLRKQNPTDPQHAVSLAFALRRAQSIEAAEKILRVARERFPQEAVIWFNLACYAAQQGRLVETRDLLCEAVKRETAYRDLAKTDSDLTPFWQAVGAGDIAKPW